jgi:hypothetical protein
LAGGFDFGFPLQVMEHKGCPVFLRQPVHFGVDNLAHFLPGEIGWTCRLRHELGLPFMVPSFGRPGPGLPRNAIGHSVQPAGHRRPLADSLGLADEHQERGLERVRGIVLVPQHPLAQPQHHGAVSLQEDREGRFLVLDRKSVDQVAVRGFKRNADADQAAQMLEDRDEARVNHGSETPGGRIHSTRISAAGK